MNIAILNKIVDKSIANMWTDYYVSTDNALLLTETKTKGSTKSNQKSIEPHLEISLLDVDKFIKDNPSTKEITSSIFFDRPGSPDPNGLLSNQIFGITKEERAGIFGYIDLSEKFIHPLIYKKLTRIDRKFRDIIHGNRYFTINSSGELVEDSEKGHTGLNWLRANFDKIKLKTTDKKDSQRNKVVSFIKKNRNLMFMDKLLVIPAYYRDVNTEQKGKVSVGEINELYSSIITNVRGIRETGDFGLDVSDSIRGRVQEGILAVYDYICGNTNDLLEGSSGLSKKTGIIRRAGLSKTTDYGSRLILSAPNLRVEKLSDLNVDITHAEVPMASLMANFLPFVIYHTKRFIDNNFAEEMALFDSKGKITYKRIDDAPLIWSDEVIKEEIDNFIHSYSNRFKPFEYKDPDTGKSYRFRFKGKKVTPEEFKKAKENGTVDSIPTLNRYITWCDIFYLSIVEATKDKCVLVTRYPMNQNVA